MQGPIKNAVTQRMADEAQYQQNYEGPKPIHGAQTQPKTGGNSMASPIKNAVCGTMKKEY